MLITIVSSDITSRLEVSDDIELENFIAFCRVEMEAFLGDIPVEKIRLIFNGHILIPDQTNLKTMIKVLNINDGDVIHVDVFEDDAVNNSHPSSSTSGGVTSIDAKSLISNLVSGITVPSLSKPKGLRIHSNENRDHYEHITAKSLFDQLSDPVRRDMLRADAPDLVDAYEQNPNNPDAFLIALHNHKMAQKRKQQLAMDPTSEEGQRFIAEMIDRENINFSQEFAMEHMPEAFVPVNMLYIRMRINGHPLVAFIDSGAQVSILSEACARRCNVLRLVDRRYRAVAIGVGGSSQFVGRIHACQVEINGHVFACPFDVMGDRNMDLLLGLNTLLRHKCCIDLQRMVLRFGDGTETSFLTEAESQREKESVERDIMNAASSSEVNKNIRK